MDKLKLLKTVFGHSEFRDGQEAVIDRILEGGDVLSVMPTGAGKSICYQLPALMKDGITLVVSPLISLMKDQAASLEQFGVNAAFLNSSLTSSEFMQTLKKAEEGAYKILYVAPERLETEAFVSFAEKSDIFMLTVDEAHCVSQWGQDFRPSYLRICNFIDRLKKRPVVSAFTATATASVRNDIIKQLKLISPLEVTMSFDRPNLYFEVQNITKSQKNAALLETMKRYNGKSGIVYCSTRKTTELVYHELSDAGYSATLYHAGLADYDRRVNQEDFVYDRKAVMVATNAFGMGIDKSNVSFVIHFNMPKSIEAYYQEAGRAGRDGEKAECVMLYSSSDIFLNNFFIDNMLGENLSRVELETAKNRDRERLRRMTDYCGRTDCLRKSLLGYFGEKTEKKCGNCSNCLGKFELEEITLSAQKIISCVFRLKQRDLSLASTAVAAVLKGGKVQAGLETLSTYGIMSEHSTSEISRIIDFLVAEEYLGRSADGRKLLYVTAKGDAMIRERQSVYMKKTSVKKKKEIVSDKLVSAEDKLYLKLKALRAKIAEEQHIPAYIVFSNATLTAIAERKPRSAAEFLEISGVGETKMERYGNAFIDVINQYLREAV